MSDKQQLKMVSADLFDGDKLLVAYSNGTTSVYAAKQIMGLVPEASSDDFDEPGVAVSPQE